MNLQEVLILLNAKLVCGEELLERIIDYASASDLMSDVLTLGEKSEKSILLLTGLANVQTIRTAEMSELKMIILVRGKKASPEMIEIAIENQIAVAESPYSLYRSAGLLWKAGLPPVY